MRKIILRRRVGVGSIFTRSTWERYEEIIREWGGGIGGGVMEGGQTVTQAATWADGRQAEHSAIAQTLATLSENTQTVATMISGNSNALDAIDSILRSDKCDLRCNGKDWATMFERNMFRKTCGLTFFRNQGNEEGDVILVLIAHSDYTPTNWHVHLHSLQQIGEHYSKQEESVVDGTNFQKGS